MRSRFRKVVFDVPYSTSRTSENDFLIQLLPLFTNLSSISFETGTAEIFFNYSRDPGQLRLQQVEQRRRVLEHINARITSVSFVGQKLEHVVDLLRVFSKDHLLEIKLDWTVASQIDSTKWEEFFKILPPSVRTLDVDRSPPKESSKESEESKKAKSAPSGTKEAAKDKQAIAALPNYPKEWLVPSNWPALTKVILRVLSYTSIDHDFLAQFKSLEVLEVHQTYGMDDIDIIWGETAVELETKLVAIPPLAHLRSLSLRCIHLLFCKILQHTIYDHEEKKELTEGEDEPSAMEVEKDGVTEGGVEKAVKGDPVKDTAGGRAEGGAGETDGTNVEDQEEEEEEHPAIHWTPSLSRVIDPDFPFVVGCDSYLEEPDSICVQEQTWSRPFPNLEEFTLQSVDPCIDDDELWDFIEIHSSTLRRFSFYNLGQDWCPSARADLSSKPIFQGIDLSLHPYHPEAHISETFVQHRDMVFPHWISKSNPHYDYFRKPKDDALILKLKSLLDYGQERLTELTEQVRSTLSPLLSEDVIGTDVLTNLIEKVEKGGEAGDLYRFAWSLKAFELDRAACYD